MPKDKSKIKKICGKIGNSCIFSAAVRLFTMEIGCVKIDLYTEKSGHMSVFIV